jgi:hypothetical protein
VRIRPLCWVFAPALGCLYEPGAAFTEVEACEARGEALADEIYAAPQGCAAVLEMDADYDLIQWALVCGPEEELEISESQARRLTECCEEDGTAVNRPDPADAFVFYDADDMGNGTIAVVSRHTATRVFEATLQGGDANVRFPTMNAFRGPSELAIDCQPEEILEVSSYDEEGDAPPVALVEVLATAKKSGIVDAMRTGDGELIWTVVLRNGAGEPGNGGWVAVLQSSSLEIDFAR